MQNESTNSSNEQESTLVEPKFFGLPFSELIHRVNLNWEERIASRLWKASNGCLLWPGHLSADGYGIMRLGKAYTVRVHMVVFMYHTQEPIPKGMEICHRCDTPACANFEHLFLGTRLENQQDKAMKGRAAQPYFSKLTAQQILDIKRLLAEKKLTQMQIAKMFFVGQATISEIKNDRRPFFANTKAI